MVSRRQSYCNNNKGVIYSGLYHTATAAEVTTSPDSQPSSGHILRLNLKGSLLHAQPTKYMQKT